MINPEDTTISTQENILNKLSKIFMIDRNVSYQLIQEKILKRYPDLQVVDSKDIEIIFFDIFGTTSGADIKAQLVEAYTQLNIHGEVRYYDTIHQLNNIDIIYTSSGSTCLFSQIGFKFNFKWFWGQYKDGRFEFYNQPLTLIKHMLHNNK